MDQAGDHSAGPGSGIELTVLHHSRIHATHFTGDIFELEIRAERFLLLEQAHNAIVVEHSLSIAQPLS